MSEGSLERVRRICLGLPGATEKVAWGEPTFRAGKIFASFASADSHHGRGGDGVWCNAPLAVQEVLVRSEPEKYFVPPYVGVKGWIGIRVEEVSDEELAGHLLQSYCMVAPKKLRALLPE